MSWKKKVKGLFVVSEGEVSSETPADLSQVEAQVDADLAALELPAGQVGTLPAGTDPGSLKGTIDFQGLYDQAGIPNTDEVEQLEKFLEGLDNTLPQASRLAASKAFLSAIGKAPDHVMKDAARKIEVVRAVGEVKGADASSRQNELQTEIARLEAQIDECRTAMEGIRAELESVRTQCATEEGRLQAARVFFGVLK
ncbi:MAG TPA: hypothetical protein VMZ28_24155 [Kofleriaceae bacterium]|nr:hypothetical protein [Kofleriaceae bacterium]